MEREVKKRIGPDGEEFEDRVVWMCNIGRFESDGAVVVEPADARVPLPVLGQWLGMAMHAVDQKMASIQMEVAVKHLVSQGVIDEVMAGKMAGGMVRDAIVQHMMEALVNMRAIPPQAAAAIARELGLGQQEPPRILPVAAIGPAGNEATIKSKVDSIWGGKR
jgi:hypothetical protein